LLILIFFARAVRFARVHNILLCHDAPYSDVTYDDYTAPSILQVSGAKEVAVEFNSLSKTFNMAGWRVGMAVGNAPALALLAWLKSNIDSGIFLPLQEAAGIFLPLQEAAVRAFSIDQQWIVARNAIYHRRLTSIVAALHAFGINANIPPATLYVWTRVPDGWGAEEFALALPLPRDRSSAQEEKDMFACRSPPRTRGSSRRASAYATLA
jgi:LL-diaminopimelate aminotransferase